MFKEERIMNEIKKYTKNVIINTYWLKNENMYQINYKFLNKINEKDYYVAQAKNIGKINFKTIKIISYYKDGYFKFIIVINKINHLGDFKIRNTENDISVFYSKLNFFLQFGNGKNYKYICGEYERIKIRCGFINKFTFQTNKLGL